MSRHNRLEWLFAALLLVGLSAAAGIANAGARRGAAASQVRSAVSVIDTATNTVAVKAIEVGRYPEQIAITPDGDHAYVTSLEPGVVSVIDLATGKPVTRAIKVGPLPIALAITPAGRHVYVVKN